MTSQKYSDAEETWVQKVDERASVVGAVVVLMVIAFPLMLL